MGEDNSGSDDQNKIGQSHQEDLGNGITDIDANVEDIQYPCVSKEENVENNQNITDNIKTYGSVKPIDNYNNNSQVINATDIVDNNVSSAALDDCGKPSEELESENNSVQTTDNPLQDNLVVESSTTHEDVAKYGENGEIIDYQEPIDFGNLDIRVGSSAFLLRHPEPTKKVPFMERITVGISDNDELETYDVESGIPKHYKMTDVTYNKLVVVCNIKPVTRRGLENKIAVLCARKEDKTDLLLVPKNAKIGDPIVVDGYSRKTRIGVPYVSNIFRTLGPDLRVNKKKQVEYKGIPLKVKTCGSYITTRRLSDCGISTTMEGVDI